VKSRELRNIAFIFVNDYFSEETGELVGVRADYLNEFRVTPVDFGIYDIRHGTYILFAGKKTLHDEIGRDEVSEEEVFSDGTKRMIWLSYSTLSRYEKSIWMRLRVTKIPECSAETFAERRQRALCSASIDAIDGIIRSAKPSRVYVLPNLMSGLIPVTFMNELKRYTATAEKLFLGFSSRYRSIVVYPYRCRK